MTALSQPVPDIHGIQPNAADNWQIGCCSGQPVEWDKNTSGGPGAMHGQTQVFRYCTLPRLIIPSLGWFHSWECDVRAWVINFVSEDGFEVRIESRGKVSLRSLTRTAAPR